jgi:hypothetical protein
MGGFYPAHAVLGFLAALDLLSVSCSNVEFHGLDHSSVALMHSHSTFQPGFSLVISFRFDNLSKPKYNHKTHAGFASVPSTSWESTQTAPDISANQCTKSQFVRSPCIKHQIPVLHHTNSSSGRISPKRS